jgi:hypothetical protein
LQNTDDVWDKDGSSEELGADQPVSGANQEKGLFLARGRKLISLAAWEVSSAKAGNRETFR